MTKSEVSAKVNQLVERALDANDERLAAAVLRFCQVTGLPSNDSTDQAIGALPGAIGTAYSQAVTAAIDSEYSQATAAAFWASHNNR